MKITAVKKIFLYYLPVFIWMGLIFYLSSIPGLQFKTENIPIEIVLRKSAHFFEYAILALLLWRTAYKGEGCSRKYSQILAFALVILYAAGDEIHQAFTEGRAGKLIDVIVDVLSGLIPLLLVGIKQSSQNAKKRLVTLIFTVLIVIGIIIFLMIVAESRT